MDAEAEEEERRKLEARRKRSVTYCRGCNGDLTLESPHPLGGNLVVLQCAACGREETLVKEGGKYKRAGRRPRRFKL